MRRTTRPLHDVAPTATADEVEAAERRARSRRRRAA
jgi:hypothetical protein